MKKYAYIWPSLSVGRFFMFWLCVCLTTFHVIKNIFQLFVSRLTFEVNWYLQNDLVKDSAKCKEGLWTYKYKWIVITETEVLHSHCI